jgi:hypothetical protein
VFHCAWKYAQSEIYDVLQLIKHLYVVSGVPRNFFSEGGSTISVEDRGQRELGSGGGSPLVRGSGGRFNLVQEISFHTIKFFIIFGTLYYL